MDVPTAQRLTLAHRAGARAGTGSAIAHHGEVLQGVFDDGDGLPVHALVTLPLPGLRSVSVFSPDRGRDLRVRPAWKVKALAAAQAALRRLGCDGGGDLEVRSSIAAERGLGSSTADVVSAIEAVAAALGRRIEAEDIARLAVAAERASDGVMFGDRTVLFASREGRVLEDLGKPLPRLEVVSLDIGEGVDTLALEPIRYTRAETETFADLRSLLRKAVGDGSAELVAKVATGSAEINQRYRPHPCFALAAEVAGHSGALGIQVAHTGTVIGLLYDPDARGLPCSLGIAAELIERAGAGPPRRYGLPGLPLEALR
ncbi:hypothetical protein [Amycolatopsis sp. MtRt-6]|uniref:GHMP family kinase ATP-binding protein n=1 Tax=Amycolatopsis sp. MtRt-6 TaxID=2792782 RepID=UPI001A8DCF85|nr:hypothetical protein [Amycolatopsis sp. MtRt-6]